MIKKQIQQHLTTLLTTLGITELEPQVDYPIDTKFGDYTTNVALLAAKKVGKRPRELAENIKERIENGEWGMEIFEKIEVAGPGFINFWIKNDALIASNTSLDPQERSFYGKKIVVEFAHPNTHKAFHIGHLRNITTGESIVRLLQAAGAQVVRVNYQGDVGMHIAKCLYGMMHNPEFDIAAVGEDVHERVTFLGKAYAAGSKAYDEDKSAQEEIREINKKIYAKDASIWDLYQTTRQWSLDYFEMIYKRVDTHFDRLYFESEVYESGKKTVEAGLQKGIFVKSDGAVIFPGSKFNLHDRVFISSEGNPTYEGKEMGLGPLQFKEHNPDLIMHVVGPEQAGYFQVVFEALAQLYPETRGKEKHLAYGWVKLKHGKMSSRTGNVVLGEWLLDEAKKRILETYESASDVAETIAVGAVKYSFLKVGLGQEIAFDLDESISLQGNSGPYLQYAYVRTQSVLEKSEKLKVKSEKFAIEELSHGEREVLRLLVRFPEIVEEAAVRYAPQILCTYLFELAQTFNLFYQKMPILKAADNVRDFRLHLTDKTGEVIKHGLHLLGINVPQKM